MNGRFPGENGSAAFLIGYSVLFLPTHSLKEVLRYMAIDALVLEELGSLSAER